MAMPQTGQWRMGGRGFIANPIAEYRCRKLIQINADGTACKNRPPRRDFVPAKVIYLNAGTVDARKFQKMWNPISSAPAGADLELAVIDNDGPHALVFPCRRIAGGWINTVSKERLDVRPTHWRAWQPERENLKPIAGSGGC
jgi:hypothetical protein